MDTPVNKGFMTVNPLLTGVSVYRVALCIQGLRVTVTVVYIGCHLGIQADVSLYDTLIQRKHIINHPCHGRCVTWEEMY
jgi:hypothetical protein